MSTRRAQKETVRELWTELVANQAPEHTDLNSPVYLSLTGGLGQDIDLLIKRGLIGTTESGAIKQEDGMRFVAVESSPDAVLTLQRRFPGLKILEVPFESLVSGPSPTVFPTGDYRHQCRAKIINLDFNKPLHVRTVSKAVIFPPLEVVQKLCMLHRAEPPLDWTLCLTFHAEINWPVDVCAHMRNFLTENFKVEPEFAESCRLLFGDHLYGRFTGGQALQFGNLPRKDQQAVLMAIVPKKISHMVYASGWRVSTLRNLRYGGETKEIAPMVTWIIRFALDALESGQPQAVYRESLRGVLNNPGYIEENGNISTLFES